MIQRKRVGECLTPAARGYIRYSPLEFGKRALWDHFFWRPHNYVVRCWPDVQIKGSTADIIQRYLYYFGIWEPHLSTWMSARLSQGDVFIDIGANIGYSALVASKAVGPTGLVIAVEPAPRAFAMLRENLKLNGAGNVRLVQAAVVDEPGSITLFEGGVANCGESTILRSDTAPLNFTPVKVEAIAFSSLLESFDPRRTKVVKIDAEGAEWLVVQGMERCLDQLHPEVEIVIETAPGNLGSFGVTFADLRALLARHGFTPYLLENDYHPDRYIRRRFFDPPRRLSGDIDRTSDLVFSRKDVPVLNA